VKVFWRHDRLQNVPSAPRHTPRILDPLPRRPTRHSRPPAAAGLCGFSQVSFFFPHGVDVCPPRLPRTAWPMAARSPNSACSMQRRGWWTWRERGVPTKAAPRGPRTAWTMAARSPNSDCCMRRRGWWASRTRGVLTKAALLRCRWWKQEARVLQHEWVTVTTKRCANQGCTKRPPYDVNDGSKRATFCFQHAEAGMVVGQQPVVVRNPSSMGRCASAAQR